jgi:hypothetical protein
MTLRKTYWEIDKPEFRLEVKLTPDKILTTEVRNGDLTGNFCSLDDFLNQNTPEAQNIRNHLFHLLGEDLLEEVDQCAALQLSA